MVERRHLATGKYTLLQSMKALLMMRMRMMMIYEEDVIFIKSATTFHR